MIPTFFAHYKGCYGYGLVLMSIPTIARQPDTQGQSLHLMLQGNWEVAEAKAVHKALQQVPIKAAKTLIVDAQGVERLDITAAWFIYQQVQYWQQQGLSVELQHIPEEYLHYFTAITTTSVETSKPAHFTRWVRQVGSHTLEWGKALYSWVGFLGHSLISLGISLIRPRQFRARSLFHHVFATGITAVPIVGLIACLISIVITYQGGGQLRDLGAEIYTVDMVAISVLRELGVLLTAIMMAGRSGSAFAAEIGLMKTNQEVDALEVMGSDPFMILVVPRLLALLITLPLLTILADIVALVAAAVISSTILDISFLQFFTRIQTNIEFRTFAAGIIKAPFFAIVIALIGCWQGMRVTGSSESLGLQTTKAVVDAIFLVLVLDALFSVLFYRLGF